jgi:subtilase family serine protease
MTLWTAHAVRLGAAPGSTKVNARVYLAPRGGLAAVQRAATAMSTPGSGSYHRFLTPAQYRARFGTTAATVHVVAAYLRSCGLRVTGFGAGNRYISVTGTAATAERAFGARIDRYRHNGRTVQAPSAALEVPASLASSVLAITGLDTTPKIVRPNVAPPAGFRNARPCSAYYGQLSASDQPQFNGHTLPYAVCGYTGPQLRSAYEGNTSLDGSGISVAITDAYADGDELAATGTKQVDYPASDPYATGVGGTSAAIGATGNRLFETGWGTDKYTRSADGRSWDPLGFLYGGGGGSSALFARPAYQDGVTSSPSRQVPDVAMDGDPTTGMLVGETQSFPQGVIAYDEYRIGGTSLSSPLFAGMTALALQHAGGAGAGLLNNAIYAHRNSFTDVAGSPPDVGNVRPDFVNSVDASRGIVYSVRTFNQDSSLQVTTGYDQVTGLGVPNTRWLSALG